MADKLFQRKIVPKISAYLDDAGIILLAGARRVGKTCILQLLMEELRANGVSEKKIHYFDLEYLDILSLFNSGADEFIGHLKAHGVDVNAKNYIFADEIQYMDNPANFLKLLADHHQNLKLIVSGSSTLEIRRKFKDSLAGRKVVFEVYPLDFYEFLVFKNERALYGAIAENDIRHMNIEKDIKDSSVRFFAGQLTRHFKEYVIFGGYPQVVIESQYEKKTAYLMDIYNSYVKKDIKDIMRVDNVTAFNNLLKALALQIGSLVNITELCNTVKIARETIERYLFLLENTFIIKNVTPFSGNPRKEISKMSKIYFVDTGLRNIAIGNLNEIDGRVDAGALVENAVCCNIQKNLAPLEEIHFWRTLAGNEVDFVLTQGNKIKPIEVKYSGFKSARVPLGIRNFRKDYKSVESIVLTRDYSGKADDTFFLPVWLC